MGNNCKTCGMVFLCGIMDLLFFFKIRILDDQIMWSLSTPCGYWTECTPRTTIEK